MHLSLIESRAAKNAALFFIYIYKESLYKYKGGKEIILIIALNVNKEK
jgi:hypothetical protein